MPVTTRLRIPAVLLAAGVLAASALAGTAQAPKVGVLDSQKVLENSAEGKRVIAQLAERDKALQAAVAKIDEEVRQLENRLSTQAATLSAQAAEDLSVQLERKRTERTRAAEDARREMQALQLRLFQKVQDELLPLIEQLGKDQAYDMILDLAKSGLVYMTPATDVTAEVIKRYDAAKAAGR